MMRWKHGMVGLALIIAMVAGCKQQCFLTECDYNHYQSIGLTPKLETDIKASIEPATLASPPPATVLDPERKIRYLSLSETIAIALEQGRVGDQDPLGTTLTSLINIGIPASSDTIRVLALDPAIFANDIDASLARFDAQWSTAMTWTSTDEPANGLNQFNTGNSAQFQSSLLKPLPTGGVSGITFSTQYQRLSNSPIANIQNPAYTPRLQFQFEQPLLQGYGVEVNQLRTTHPGSVLTPFALGGRVPGILITRLRFDEGRAEFERRVHLMLRNVETAYWNLYDAYWTLYSREQAMRQAYEAWKINKARYEAGRISVQDYAQTRQQFELFRGQRLQQLGSGTVNDGVLERERILRNLLALPVEDGTRLVPIDAPTLTPYRPDWATSVNETLALRPELIIARQDLKLHQLNLINVKNLLLPDLRFTSTYALNGIGKSLDGTVSNAFRSLASDRFTDWSLGLRFNYTIGYRDAYAQVRTERLNLARSYLVLQEQEQKAQYALAVDYRHLFEFYELIQIQRAQREAAAVQLQARFKEYQAGRGTLDILLESQRVWADALRMEFDAITQYNNAIVGFEFSKGTIMQFDNVVISEGPLPRCAQVRAVEHERERSQAILLRERANPLNTCCYSEKGGCGIPELPANEAPTLPQVLDGLLPTPTVTEPQPKALESSDAKPESSSKASSPQSPFGGPPASSTLRQPEHPDALIPVSSLSVPPAPQPNATGNANSDKPPQTTPPEGVPVLRSFFKPPQVTTSAGASNAQQQQLLKPNDTKTESTSKTNIPQTPPASAVPQVNTVQKPQPATPAVVSQQPPVAPKLLKVNDTKPENSSKLNPAPVSDRAQSAPKQLKPNDAKTESPSKATPPPIPSAGAPKTGTVSKPPLPPSDQQQAAPKPLKPNAVKPESTGKPEVSQKPAEGVPGFIIKPESTGKPEVPQKPMEGVPGFIIRSQPAPQVPAGVSQKPTPPNDAKRDSSSKANPVLPPGADGVPGFIILSQPSQPAAQLTGSGQTQAGQKLLKGGEVTPPNPSKTNVPPPSAAGGVPGFIILSQPQPSTAPAVTADKFRPETLTARPPSVPDADTIYPSSTPYSPIGVPLYPKRP